MRGEADGVTTCTTTRSHEGATVKTGPNDGEGESMMVQRGEAPVATLWQQMQRARAGWRGETEPDDGYGETAIGTGPDDRDGGSAVVALWLGLGYRSRRAKAWALA